MINEKEALEVVLFELNTEILGAFEILGELEGIGFFETLATASETFGANETFGELLGISETFGVVETFGAIEITGTVTLGTLHELTNEYLKPVVISLQVGCVVTSSTDNKVPEHSVLLYRVLIEREELHVFRYEVCCKIEHETIGV